MSSISEQIQKSGSPHEALLIIANALDRIEFMLKNPAGWGGGWDDPQTHAEVHEHLAYNLTVPGQGEDLQVNYYQEQLERALEAGEDERVIEALRRLANETGAAITHGPEDDSKVIVADGADGLIVELPATDPKRQNQRRVFGRDVLKLEDHFPGIDAVGAFMLGGPLWLYSTKEGRDFIIGLPDDYKRALVNDVAQDSAADALDMGKDILKDVKSGAGVDFESLTS